MKIVQKLGLLVLVLCLGGCATQELTKDMDTVLGGNYVAPLNRYPGTTPTRVLVLPVTGSIQPSYKQVYLNDFLATLHQGREFLVTPYGDDLINQTELKISGAAAQARAQLLKCDSLLYMALQNQQVFPPLRVTVKITLISAQDGTVLVDGILDYDVQNELVANSARRYYQSRLQRMSAPDKSLAILENNQLFLRYVGYDVGKAILRAFSLDQ